MSLKIARPVMGLLALALATAFASAHAAPTQLSTSKVTIDFDPDSFAFSHEVPSFGGVTSEDISPASLSYSLSGHGVKIDFNDLMSVYATSYTDFSPQTLTGLFNAGFSFSAAAGYKITGYTITYAGTYSIETPGYVDVSGPGGGFSASSGGGSFSQSGVVAGAVAPQLSGSISATGDIGYVQVFDGYDHVFDHYEQVLDYCDEYGQCYYHDEPVYIDVPIYHDETDLGEASLNLKSITIEANVVPVPEPQTLALLAAGVPLAFWLAARRRRGA